MPDSYQCLINVREVLVNIEAVTSVSVIFVITFYVTSLMNNFLKNIYFDMFFSSAGKMIASYLSKVLLT